MSLSLAYNIARSALNTSAAKANVVSSNVANADNPNAARKTALVVTGAGGTPYLEGIRGQVDQALFDRSLEAIGTTSQAGAIADAIAQLATVNGDPEFNRSPAALIGGLRDALQTASAVPHDEAALQAVLTASDDLVRGLNDAAQMTASVRTQTNSALGESVAELKALLEKFETVNRAIVTGAAMGVSDLSDEVDHRNGIVGEIAKLVNVRVVTRGENDMTLYLANGLTLFETSPREIAFDERAPILTGLPGPGLRIDGVPADLGGNIGGRIGGLLIARDDVSLKFGRQMDEIARGLVAATAEFDQSAVPALPPLAGLLTYDGGPSLPAPGVVTDGFAGRIRVNANVDPTQGGVLTRLRDGGISDPGNPNYVYNATSGASFSGRLLGLIGGLSASQPFDPATGLARATGGVLEVAVESAGWIEGERSSSADAHENNKLMAEKASSAWQSRIGVNLDDELSSLIALERSYQASTRLIGSVNNMFDALIDATR